MASLLKQIEARMADPKSNENFNQEVNKKHEVTEKDKQSYALAHKSFQEYKENELN